MPLSAQTNAYGDSDGQGGPPPSRLQSFTPPADVDKNKKDKATLLFKLKNLLAVNERWASFCSDPASIVDLHVKPEDEQHLHRSQYPTAEALKPAVRKILDRWRTEGKIKPAPANTRFNSPLLVQK